MVGFLAAALDRRGSLAIVLLLITLVLGGCGGGGSDEPDGLTYVALGDSWPEGAHCNGCRTFAQGHADAVAEELGGPVTVLNLAGQAQPYFETPGGGGSAGLLKALQTDEAFRDQVATGDIIVISTGPNDGGEIFEAIESGTCGGSGDTECVAALGRRWHRDFDAILGELAELRSGQPTAIRLVNAANAFTDPTQSQAALRGFEAYFEALTTAMCENAELHEATCVDVRPVLNGPEFEQPVNDSSQESMDAVAELLVQAGLQELE